MTLSPELVTEWIDSFPISVYLFDALEHMSSEKPTSVTAPSKHKEEGGKRRQLDSDDRHMISHPLSVESDVIYNIVNGQVAPEQVNVDNALVIGEKMANSFQNSLPSGFHSKISCPVKTMEHLKRGMKVGGKVVFDLETIFLRLLIVGQQRQLQLAPIFQYELCAVPPSLIDEYGCLRKGNVLVCNRLKIQHQTLSSWMCSRCCITLSGHMKGMHLSLVKASRTVSPVMLRH